MQEIGIAVDSHVKDEELKDSAALAVADIDYDISIICEELGKYKDDNDNEEEGE